MFGSAIPMLCRVVGKLNYAESKNSTVITKQINDVVMISYSRVYEKMTSSICQYNVICMSCTCWQVYLIDRTINNLSIDKIDNKPLLRYMLQKR